MAGVLLRPVAPLAARRQPLPRLSDRWLGEVPRAGTTVELPRGADVLGLEWDAAGAPQVRLRLLAHNGRWSPWVSAAGCLADEPSEAASRARVIGAPVWTAGATAVQVRPERALSGVRLHLIDASDGAGARRAALARSLLGAGAAAALPVLAPATAGQPRIIARAAWAHSVAHPRVAPGYGSVRMAFVHHTENPNGYLASEVPAMLLSIFLYHRDVRGWNDIGYNFVIDAFGRTFEARAGGIDEPVVGAQAGGFNLESTGVAVLGSFSSELPPPAALRSLRELLAWKLSLHGVPATGRARVRVNPAGAVYSRFPARAHVSLPHIAGHRDGDSTDCPGDAFYARLRAIRAGVRALAPNPTHVTLALSLAPPPPGPSSTAPPEASPSPAVTARTPLELSGSHTSAEGAPVAGAAVALQVRSVSVRGEVVRERTVAEVATDAAGAWSLAGRAAGSLRGKPAWLRALYRGSPGEPAAGGATVRAAVSAPLAVPAAVIAALAGAPSQAASPSPSP